MQKKKVFRAKEVAGYSPSGYEGTFVSRLLIDGEGVGSQNIMLNVFTLMPGQKTSPGSHPIPYEEVYYVLRGKGIVKLGGVTGEQYALCEDTVVYIAGGEEHELENTGEEPLELVTVMPFHPTPGVNPLYDGRMRDWGTSFLMVGTKNGSTATSSGKSNAK